MRHIRKFWTYERCKEEALKFDSVTEFKNGSLAYSPAYRNGWMDNICSHMVPTQKPTGYWTKEKCGEEALKYKTKSEFQENSGGAYNSSKRNNWLDEICLHMIPTRKPSGYWTYEKCQEEALKYSSKLDFQINSNVAYDKAYKKKWLNDICSHMIQKSKPGGYWTYEKCKEKALEYKTRYDFYVNNYGAYGRAYRNGWLDDICSHMIIQNNNTKRCIYCYEFPDNSVYVGLTYDIEKRQKNRDISDFDQVIIHTKKTGLTPIRKQLTDYIEVNDAIKLEGYYVEKYKNEGWNILNKSKTGAIGGPLRWTYEKCKQEALKYKSRREFKVNSPGSYSSSLKNNWMDEICSHMIPTQKPTGYWTFDRCKEEALKYKSKNEFKKISSNIYSAAYKKGWLDEICSHMDNKIVKPKNYWTYDKCEEESLQFKTKRDFYEKSQSAYNAAYRNGWLEDFFKNKRNI